MRKNQHFKLFLPNISLAEKPFLLLGIDSSDKVGIYIAAKNIIAYFMIRVDLSRSHDDVLLQFLKYINKRSERG